MSNTFIFDGNEYGYIAWMKNNADPDLLAEEPADLDLHFPKSELNLKKKVPYLSIQPIRLYLQWMHPGIRPAPLLHIIITMLYIYSQQCTEWRELNCNKRALDRSPESRHMSRWFIGMWLRSYDMIYLKIFLFLALVAMLFSQAEPSGANFINKVRTIYLKLCVRCFLRSAYVSFIKTS